MSERHITISISSIIILVFTGLLLVLLWQLKSLLIVLMIAIVVAATLSPIIERAQRLKIPRTLAVVLVYASGIALSIAMGLAIGPTAIDQVQLLFARLPGYLEILTALAEHLAARLGIDEPETLERLEELFDIQALAAWGFRSTQLLIVRSLGITRGLIGGIFSLLLALLISGYILSGSKDLTKSLVNLFPKPWDERIEAQIAPIAQRMGGYIQGRLLVSVILGIAVGAGLRIVGISEYALGLGAIAAITNLIPFFGPVLGAIPALVVALPQGGWTVLWVLLLFAIVQNLETYVLDPIVVGSSVKVLPLYQLLAVLGGTLILGILGAVIVPPWVAGATVAIENLYLKPKLQAERENAPLP